jgi:phosphoribosyl 1,2-cyclic phosphodiesterase
MKVWILGSGSSGNAVLVECGGARVLVDAGFGTRTIAGRLKLINIAPASIEACIITHEHTDHVKGAAAGRKRWGWSLFASEGTVDAWPDLQEANCTRVPVGGSVLLSRMTLTTHAVPHDAASPIGVRVTSASTGANVVVCTDLGHANDSVRALCRDADILLLESNHDEMMLRNGPYPYSVQRRIASRTGHLSNRASAELAREVSHAGLAHVVLSHISENCNEHGLAHRVMREHLKRSRFRGQTSVALQHSVIGPLMPRPSRAEAEAQYQLAL